MPTKIEWTDETWNSITGCTPISGGCKNCYARRMSKRLAGRFGYPQDDPFKVTLHPEKLGQPFRWRKSRRIFLNSMGDTFHDDVPTGSIDKIFAVMAMNSRHTFLILTKRPVRMHIYLKDPNTPFRIQQQIDAVSVDIEMNGVKEIWRPIPEFEDLYEVSNYGRIKSFLGNHPRILKNRDCRKHNAVSLRKSGDTVQLLVARIVLITFFGMPKDGQEVCHRNGNGYDDRIANLRWGSRSDNMADAARHGTAGTWMKTKTPITSHQVVSIREERKAGAKLKDIAKHYGLNKQRVSKICREEAHKKPALTWPLPNVHLGVSTENQAMADERIPLLLQTPASKRFISAEPLLGPIDFSLCGTIPSEWVPGGGYRHVSDFISQIIVGAETGPGKRPMNLDWVRDIRDQCQSANVPFFFKKDSDGNHELDGKIWEGVPR